MRLKDKNIIESGVYQDQEGKLGLYIIPDKPCEMCIEEEELEAALLAIKEEKLGRSFGANSNE